MFARFFLSQKSAKGLTLGTVHGLILQLCVTSPLWPCSIARLAVAVFIAPTLPHVYSPVFSFNVVPAAVMMVDGD